VRASAKASAARPAVPACKLWVGGAVGRARRAEVPRVTGKRPFVHPSQSEILFLGISGMF